MLVFTDNISIQHTKTIQLWIDLDRNYKLREQDTDLLKYRTDR